ncbi:MAG TPA: protoporphyrinogen oxidase [Bacteroidota bacterium]|nr:protoporphyrinogen oxidase [Bacteroidota bacterium]
MTSPVRHSVAVVGAGISGLATAWWLHRMGIDIIVLEQDSSAGGTMKTLFRDGWLIETGPNSALETTPLLRSLSEEAGVVDELVYASPAAENRYILRNDTLHPLPMAPGPFLRSNLWSFMGKLRLLKEPFVGKALKEETVAEFVTRRLGREFLDYAINPFVAGVYAGDPAELSVQAAFPKLYALEKNYGGLIKGQILGARERKKREEKAKDRSRLFAFSRGMETLPGALARKLGERVRYNVEVASLAPYPSDGAGHSASYLVRGSEGGSSLTIQADAVVLAVPAKRASAILESLSPGLANSLKKIYYPPVAEVFLGYASEEIGRPLDGFGFLVPEREKRKILGTIWTSAIFAGRTPPGHQALTTFVGGSRQPDLVLLDDDALVRLVREELGPIMKTTNPPRFAYVSRWREAIPQYNLGHLSIVANLEQFEKEHPGAFIGGNFRGGIAVGDCVMNSETTARRVSSYLQNIRTSAPV